MECGPVTNHTGSTVKQGEDGRWDQAIKPQGLPLVTNCGAPDTRGGGNDLQLAPSKGVQPYVRHVKLGPWPPKL